MTRGRILKEKDACYDLVMVGGLPFRSSDLQQLLSERDGDGLA